MANVNFKLFVGLLVGTLIVAGLAFLSANRMPVDLGGPAAITQEPEFTIKVASKEGMGNHLVDGKGMTLYYFPKDTINKSNCLPGGCLTAWPVFYAEKIVVPDELKAEDFGQIAREDGKKQATFKGWPLYYYYQDVKAGDTLGEGVGDIWYIVSHPFYTILSMNKNTEGNYLAGPRGMALYYFTNDRRGAATIPPQSNCSGQCLANWPAFYAEEVIAPSLMKKSDFGEIERPEGGKQATFKGWPLYYYIGDANSGDIKGQGLNNVWFLVKP